MNKKLDRQLKKSFKQQSAKPLLVVGRVLHSLCSDRLWNILFEFWIRQSLGHNESSALVVSYEAPQTVVIKKGVNHFGNLEGLITTSIFGNL